MKYDSYRLGATLYMPVIHPNVRAIVRGEMPAPAPSIVLCLEDALHENDVDRGVRTLLNLLNDIDTDVGPYVYIRPRSFDMAMRLAQVKNITNITGFVAPKVRPENILDWTELTQRVGINIMPTLESAEYFNPEKVMAIKNKILTANATHVEVVRLGGNDLMNSLGLRRSPGVSAYEGPLSWVLPMMSSILTSSGLSVSAPVFDIIHDLDTLEREVARDVEMGFVGKTAIHPSQVPVILNALAPKQTDIDMAHAILDPNAQAVFQIGGVMCEPNTHRNWANRILARQAAQKTAIQTTQMANTN